NKAQLIVLVQEGPSSYKTFVEQGKVIKNTLLAPLSDKDCSAYKLKSLNEANVRSVTNAVVSGVGSVLRDMWECCFLASKTHRWLGASLDGWLRIERPKPTIDVSGPRLNVSQGDSDSKIVSDSCEPQIVNCALETKAPGSKLQRTNIASNKQLHGTFTSCNFGDDRFKKLVYKPEY
ncbi:hypothetical protein ACHAWF_004103, partial [Thalassiosira exigua]